MKKLFLLIITLLALNVANAQNEELFLKKLTTGIDVFTDMVMNQPEGISFRGINQGANAYVMYTFPIGETNFAFALGLGLGAHNFYGNIYPTTTDNIPTLRVIPAETPSKNEIKYDKSKISLVYGDIPMEFRFKTESGFRAALGFKGGKLIDNKWKYKGMNFTTGVTEKTKNKTLPTGLADWRYGVTAQLGYKWVTLYGYYQLSRVYVDEKSPDIYPISIGLTLRPF